MNSQLVANNNSRLVVISLFFLLLQNIVVFSTHYFADTGFPWDFSFTYFAVPYYWITCVQHGVFPQWIAQEAMGYPLFMNLQSGLFYPPFWLLVLIGKSYTLHTAVVVQCLHVLLGALGMWYFVWIRRLPWIYCLIAGLAYQFFGGFYSNAEHADIIRGYALLPWFLSGLTIIKPHENSFRPLLLIPLSLFCLLTGSYPGIAIAALWMGGWFVLFQIILMPELRFAQKIFLACQRYALLVLGLLLSTIQLLPQWLQRNAVERAHDFTITSKMFWEWKNYFTFF